MHLAINTSILKSLINFCHQVDVGFVFFLNKSKYKNNKKEKIKKIKKRPKCKVRKWRDQDKTKLLRAPIIGRKRQNYFAYK
jgi:hypothetical protein